MQPTQADAYKLLHSGILAFANAERQGIRVDLEYCKSKRKSITKKIQNIEKDFYQSKFYRHWKYSLGGRKPNINSNDQLQKFLYDTKKLKPPKTTQSGKGSTDEETLESFKIPEIDMLLQVRKLKKLRDTYLKGFLKEQVNGYIHPFFNLHTARTFRSSSDKINFQNIPKRDKESAAICRKALYARPGHLLLEADYSGIEVAISACYHQDPNMLSYIKNPNSDMHGDMAEQIFFIDNLDKSIPSHKTLRSAAKNGFVFPEFYGDYYGNCATSLACNWGGLSTGRWKSGQGLEMGEFEPAFLSDHLMKNGIKNLQNFTQHIKEIENDFWNRRFPVYKQWKEDVWATYQKTGYVELLTGFRCYGPMSFNDVTNYPVQGAAFHCLLWSFIQLDKQIRKRKWKSRLIGQIHDAIVIDVYPPELNKLTKLMQKIMINKLKKTWTWITVPLDIEIDVSPVDGNYNEMTPYVRPSAA